MSYFLSHWIVISLVVGLSVLLWVKRYRILHPRRTSALYQATSRVWNIKCNYPIFTEYWLIMVPLTILLGALQLFFFGIVWLCAIIAGIRPRWHPILRTTDYMLNLVHMDKRFPAPWKFAVSATLGYLTYRVINEYGITNWSVTLTLFSLAISVILFTWRRLLDVYDSLPTIQPNGRSFAGD
ncbi:MAG: hypothetical protein HZC02_00190 [Candidatus Levybacteria bacterium]|nr:hypothetical protein [Candidatus Levybacteria bacterium]